VGFFDVAAARLCARDGPITALVGGASCSIRFALQHRVFNDYTIMSQYRHLASTRRRKIRRRCPITFMKAVEMLVIITHIH